MNKSILFIVPYPHNTAPSQRLKFEQYYKTFENHGFEVHHNAFINNNFWGIIYQKGFYLKKVLFTLKAYLTRYLLLFKVGNFDIVYVHLWGTPFGIPFYEWLLRKLSKKLIYDIDDLVYKATSSPNNKSIKFLKSENKVDFLMKHADQTLVSTDKLVNYARQFTNNISFIPATIDVSKYTIRPKRSIHEPLVIGWSGSHSTSKYLHLLDKVLKKVLQHNRVKIHVMGDPDFKIEGLDIELIQWTAETEIKNLQQFDIGLHPLPDEEWVYGKSGGKIVQYMAAGIPIVASAIGPNFKTIKDGFNGFLVTTEQEWIDRLTLLIQNNDLRKEMGENSKKTAVAQFSVEANAVKYLKAFNAL